MFFRELETDRLLLKNISHEDRNFILSQFSNEQVNRYLFDAEPITDNNGADEIIDFYLQAEPRNQHRWVLNKKNDGEKLGTCGFHCWDKTSGSCDVGYDLFPDFWGKGYMLEAMEAIIAFARSDMNVSFINARIYVENDRSIKLSEKLGFVFSGQTKDEFFRGKQYPHKIFTLGCNYKSDAPMK